MERFRLAMVAVALAAGAASADEDIDRTSEDVMGEAYVVLADGGVDAAQVANDGSEDGEGTGGDADRVGSDADDETVRPASRSPRGTDRGGHAGQVSAMARAGLGQVFGALRSQGYGGMQISETDGRIEVLATRSGERRTLVYDASDGTLLSDESQATSDGLARRLFGSKRTGTETVAGGRKAEVKYRGGKSKGASRGGKSSGAKSKGRGGAKSSGGGKSSNDRGGGGGGKSGGKKR